MSYDGSLKFDTKIDSKGFDKGLKGLGGIASKGLGILTGALTGVTVALGAGAAAGVKYNSTIENYTTSFEVMTGSADKAADVVERLKKIGASTPFELPQLADTTQLLMNYGFTADDAMDKMMMLGDISQGSADKMGRVATAYGQMSSAGKVSLEDIKQMIEAGFNPLQEISNSTGESMNSLYERISKGTISVDEITASMERATKEGGKYYQSMEKQSKTVSGMISTLKDNAQQLLGEVVQPITESIAGELLPAAIDAIEKLTTSFREDGTEGLIEAGSEIMSDLIVGIAKKAPDVIKTAFDVVNMFVENLSGNTGELLECGANIISGIMHGITDSIYIIVDSLPAVMDEITDFFSSDGFTDMIASGTELIGGLIAGLIQAIPILATKIPEINAAIIDALTSAEAIEGYKQAGADIVDGIISAFTLKKGASQEETEQFMNSLLSTAMTIQFGPVGSMMANDITRGLSENKEKIYTKATEVINFVKALFTQEYWQKLGQDIVAKIASGISSMVELIKAKVQSIVDSIKSIFTGGGWHDTGSKVTTGVKDGLNSDTVTGKISSIVGNMKKSFTNISWSSIGSSIVEGIASGLSKGVNAVTSAAKNVATAAYNAAKNKLKINSPSKLFRDKIGSSISEGMAVGIEKNSNLPEDAVTDLSKSVLKDAESALSRETAGIQIGLGASGRVTSPAMSNLNNADAKQSFLADVYTTVELDGKKVGQSIVKGVDMLLGQNEALRARGV